LLAGSPTELAKGQGLAFVFVDPECDERLPGRRSIQGVDQVRSTNHSAF
jgi:hypothetical protein